MKEVWLERAQATRRRYNFAVWLAAWLPLCVFVCCIAAAVLLWLRQHVIETTYFWTGFATLLFATAVLAHIRSRSQYLSLQEALIRLETRHGLHSRLSAAYAGAGEYPEARESIDDGRHLDGTYWNTSRIATPLAIALLALVVAQSIPVSPVSSTITGTMQQPLSLTEAEELLDDLSKSEVLNPEDLDSFEEQLSQLEALDPNEWFEEGSLEAADSFRDKLEQSAEELASRLDRAGSQLEQLENSTSSTASNSDEMLSDFSETLQSLESGQLRVSPEMMDSLSDALRLEEGGLSPEQRERLRQQLNDAKKKLSDALSQGGNSQGQKQNGSQGQQGSQGSQSMPCEAGSNCSDAQNGSQGANNANGKSDQEGEPGGPGRGGDTAPLNLSEKSPQITSNRNEDLPAQEKEFELGGYLGENRRAPSTGPDEVRRSQAGTVQRHSQGGSAVTRQEYTPEESELLKKYFR